MKAPSDFSVLRLGSASSYFTEEGLVGDGFYCGHNKLPLWDIPPPPSLPAASGASVSGALTELSAARRRFLEALRSSMEVPAPAAEPVKPSRCVLPLILCVCV